MARDYHIRPWEMIDLSMDHYNAIVQDLDDRRKAASSG